MPQIQKKPAKFKIFGRNDQSLHFTALVQNKKLLELSQ